MRVLKIIGVVIGGVILLLLIAGILLVLFFDPNAYKPQIERLVQERTGREFTIEGDIGLSVFPWLGIELGPARLGQAAGFDAEPFAEMRAVDVRVKVSPLLLERRIETDTIVLDGLRLRLIRDTSGRGNWEDLIAPEGTAEAEPQTPAEEGAPAVAGLAVNGLRVSDAQLSWDDRMSGNQLMVSDLDLSSGPLLAGRPVTVESTFRIESTQPPMTGRGALQAELLADLAARRYALNEGSLRLDLAGEGLPGGTLKGDIELTAEVDMARQLAEVSQLTASLAGIQVNASLVGKEISDQPQFTGTVRVAEFNPRNLLAELGIEAPSTHDPQVLNTASLSANLQAGPQALTLDPIKGRLDDTVMTGTLNVQDFADPAVGFELAVDSIDLDRYLPPPEDEGQTVPEEGPAVPVGLPVDILRDLNLKGQLTIGQLKVNNLTMDQVLIQVDADQGLVQLNPVHADLYQGQAQAQAQIDVRGEEPMLQIENQVSGIQAEPLLSDLAGKPMLSGTGAFSASLNARGVTPEALRRSLDGNAAFSFTDGAVQGINVARLIREALARLRGEPLTAPKEPNQTDFTELQGTASIDKGVITNQDLAIKSPLLRVTGEGIVDLPQEQIDYQIRAVIVGTLVGQGGAGLEELKGIPIPIRIGGNLTEPRFSLDLQAVLSEQVEQRVQKAVEGQKEKVQEELEERKKEVLEGVEDRFKDQLRGFFR